MKASSANSQMKVWNLRTVLKIQREKKLMLLMGLR